MDERLYELMDWAAIEGIVYSEEDHPHEILGPHMTEDGLLIQAFIPTAVSVAVCMKGDKTEYPMEMEDEEGFFAALIPDAKSADYHLKVTFDNGDTEKIRDPYSFAPVITEEETKKFNAGICYNIYEKLGAHPMTIKGTKGVLFAVWAPNAMRVSVVGDFNLWDGRRHPMRRLWDSGIFELFIPGIQENDIYKYEIKAKGGLTYLKADPYANAAELRPNTASVVTNLKGFDWKDDAWLKERKKKDLKKQPMSILEIHLGSFRRPPVEEQDEKYFYTYRELAPMVADYVKEMGYTHVELMPVMEHPLDASWGYQVTGYYAPTSRYGSPKDFMYFVNYMHEQGIGVILDWVPAHFPRDTFGLCAFDGTCLYEHLDPRKGAHPHWGTLIYNYGRPEVRNFLIANALFWADKYHADGIRMDAVASMLYLDYGKNDGEWVANMYGGNENLEAIEFLKHLNSIFKKKYPDVCLIAEESTAWPKITAPVEEDGLGFDFKWNMGWMNDFTGYMSLDPYFRSYHHGELTFSMIYAYSEDFILTLSHDEVVHGKASMIGKMPGNRESQFANLRVAYGFMAAHPGKKLLFMGQDFGQYDEWSEEKGVEWELLEYPEHQQMHRYYKDLNDFYTSHPAMYQLDYNPDGFEWINSINANENTVSFVRKTRKKEEMLLIICNFAPITWEKKKIGVPYPGKYKEIFNSDRKEYGGTGVVNARVKQSRKDEADDRPDSITINVPPMSMVVFSYIKPAVKEAASAGKSAASVKGASKTADGEQAAESAASAKSLPKGARKSAAGAKKAETARSSAKTVAKSAGEALKDAVKSVAERAEKKEQTRGRRGKAAETSKKSEE